MSLARLPLPLPLASFRNRRSLLARENLASAIRLALAMPADERDTYIVADPDPATIADIVAALRAGFGRRPNLLPVPLPVVRSIMDALGRGDLWERLGGELVASPAKLLAKGWMPAVQTREGLVAMAQAASPRKSGTASRSTR
jgi:UDP-glucose 4-epimerase